jgi:antitoxin component YwqK of YwqJK toxin-antitoxin module
MKVKNLNDLQVGLDQSIEVYFDGGMKYTGRVVEYYAGNKVAEFEVVDGVKSGQEIRYFPGKKVNSILNFNDGLLDGEVKHFYENGTLEEDAVFEKGVCIKSKTYNQDGDEVDCYLIDETSADFKWLEYLRKSKST